MLRATVVVALAALAAGCGPVDDQAAGLEPIGEVTQALSFVPSLPYPAGTTMGVSQGWGGTYSHTGNLYYAIDFNIDGPSDAGIHVLAVAAGEVTYRYDGCTCEGCSCNGGWGNAIVLDHGAGEFSKVTHLQTGSIPSGLTVGSAVCRGLHIGNIGTTGYSTGNHLHFQFQSDGGLGGPSIPFDHFTETGGVPQKGGSYPSSNVELSACGPPPACEVVVDGSTTVIDDQTDCFQSITQYWWSESSGHDGHHWFTYTTDYDAPISAASWALHFVSGGDYQVEIYVPNNPASLTESATYLVRHDGADTEAQVNQSAHRGAWVTLGTFPFAAAGDQVVRVFDNTGEPYVNDDGPRVTADAVRLTPVGGCSDACAAGATRCFGDGWQECGDFDDDGCLQWGGGALCDGGTYCESGLCLSGGGGGGSDGPISESDPSTPPAGGVSDDEGGSGCSLGAARPRRWAAAASAAWLLLLLAGVRRARPNER